MDHSPPGLRTDIPGPSTTTQTEVIPPENVTPEPPVLHLQLQKPKNEKKVAWRTGTIDNENMNKKKSKCCCIYRKPQVFGESSSDSEEEECEHCFGHVEKRKQKKPPIGDDNDEPKEEGNNKNSPLLWLSPSLLSSDATLRLNV